MKKVLFGALIAFVSLCSSAFSADDIQFDTERFDWSGSYIGLGVGYTTFEMTDRTFRGGDPRPDGPSLTAFVGYNWQHDQLVFGVEGDATVGDLVGTNNNFLIPAKLEYLATLRARIGFAHDNLLFFATGGYAMASFNFEHDNPPNNGSNVSETFTGFTYGAGIEMGLGESTFARLDYTWYDLDDEVANFFGGTDPHLISIDSGHTVRLSIARKFN